VRYSLGLFALLICSCADRQPSATVEEKPPEPPRMSFTATAYSTKGNTVKGVQTQPGIVAADPKILPLGSSIRVSNAGEYSGMYVVTDLGTAIVGNRIDIYMAKAEEAREFGKKDVEVQLIARGDNVKFQPETSNTIPKSSLAPAQKVDAAAIPSHEVPASKAAVQQGRAMQAQKKAYSKGSRKQEDR
jgi:3D (Asp-Asp-Asp) domain-containing protein